MVVSRGIGILLGSCLVLSACSADGDSASTRAGESAQAFVQAWAAGEPTGNGRADELIGEVTDSLQVTGTTIDAPERATCNEGETACQVPAEVTLTMKGLGEWTYSTDIDLAPAESGEWVVDWSPQTIHPELSNDTELSRARQLPRRAPILGAGDEPLTSATEVKRVGVVPGRVRPGTYGQLSELLDIDAAGLRAQVEAAEPDWFVPVITIREPQYREVEDRLLRVPGVSVDSDTWSLTESSTWARALIGTVAPATADTLEQAGPLAAPTDIVGASGLQLAYQEQLAGKPGGTVELVDAESGATIETLFSQRPQPGEPLRTTIDAEVQDAAEAAVAEQSKKTALVAVRASTGEVLASAVGPGIQSYNSAFVGQYPPGSTFKIVSAAALLGNDVLNTDTEVACPATTTVDGKSFKNYDDFRSLSADPTFAEDIAASCNTAVVSQADELEGSDLRDWATRLGVGHDYDMGVPSFGGDVPVADDVVDRAAAMIGQGKVLASPLAMAVVAASVDSGRPVLPRLLADREPADQLEPLDAGLARDLKSMMRLAVTDGTASSLDLPGQPVHAKTGTAEIDSDDPSKTHAWIIGFRGDLAFAVLVEKGASGSADAAPVVRAFLEQAPTL